ncbi:Protein N-acetyltransferase, RimJ/RimL family [Halobacillus alkaliphilus]|uniref:Protein N-acetyltransferase, RimJ/RimL family n=1 Tax=Halobacillus alkaliphilus TaxID=396056 RepID=A0A1I2JMK4_9BACI|nr:GNAT family N-acetyltransferase [Halobacillus alkaliphilus]SFF55469.1 Protein N-acetyltransferase, RimJ/RimL family [Halobacillus alkaliphilus]
MNPILKDVRTEIETERLVLKMPVPGDGAVVNKAIQDSREQLRPWLGFVQEVPTPEDTEVNTREAHAKFLTRENLRYLIFLRENGEFVGSTGFHNINWEIPKLEIGYWINTSKSGKGYMREAVASLTEYAFKELKCVRVEIRCESENLKSRSIPERLGYDLEGILRNEELSVDGQRLTDTYIYAKVAQ